MESKKHNYQFTIYKHIYVPIAVFSYKYISVYNNSIANFNNFNYIPII